MRDGTGNISSSSPTTANFKFSLTGTCRPITATISATARRPTLFRCAAAGLVFREIMAITTSSVSWRYIGDLDLWRVVVGAAASTGGIVRVIHKNTNNNITTKIRAGQYKEPFPKDSDVVVTNIFFVEGVFQ